MKCDEVWWSVMKCDEVWWSVMKCDEMWWSAMKCDEVWSVMKCDEVWWSVMKCDEVWWSVMTCDEVWWSVIWSYKMQSFSLSSSSLLSKDRKWNKGNTILRFVLYGCETRSSTLRKQEKLRIFDSWLLREVFMSKGKELAGCWRQLRGWGLHDWFWSTNALGSQGKGEEMVGGRIEFWERNEEAMQSFVSKIWRKEATWKT